MRIGERDFKLSVNASNRQDSWALTYEHASVAPRIFPGAEVVTSLHGSVRVKPGVLSVEETSREGAASVLYRSHIRLFEETLHDHFCNHPVVERRRGAAAIAASPCIDPHPVSGYETFGGKAESGFAGVQFGLQGCRYPQSVARGEMGSELIGSYRCAGLVNAVVLQGGKC